MASTAATTDPAEMIVCSRLDGPPLRFKGWKLTYHATSSSTLAKLFVTLWQRATGGYVVEFSNYAGGTWRPDALRVETLEDALCELEAVCDGLQRLTLSDMPAGSDARSYLQDIAQKTETCSAFTTLCGHVLYDWIDLMPNSASKYGYR